MNKALTIIGLVFFSLSSSFSQTDIFGNITNSETNSEIEEAIVFINSSTKSTITNSKGFYLLEEVPSDAAQIVVYAKGFTTISKIINWNVAEKKEFNFQLSPISNDESNAYPTLSEKKKKKFLRSFTDALVGYSKEANKCVLTNPEVLNFQERKDGGFNASAKDLIEIDNNASGYTISFLLENFKLPSDERAVFSGKIFYKDKTAEDVKSFERWEKARAKNYFGSPQHFYKSVKNNSLEEDGFRIYQATLANKSQFIELYPTTRENIFELEESSTQPYLTITNYLKIIYSKEQDDLIQRFQTIGLADVHLIKPSTNNTSTKINSGTNSDHQISYISASNRSVKLDKNGLPLDSEAIIYRGYWSYTGIADWIPNDYRPTSEKEKVSSSNIAIQNQPGDIQIKNGFQLSNSLVRQEYITESGLPKDGRPAIDHPDFVRFSEAREFLKDDDLVLGVIYDEIAKAYPIRILNLHEVVNDNFAGTPVTISYSPLCRSGMAFLAETKSGEKTFGSSGLVFNNGLLLYDRETNSLWSQIMCRAISGNESGNPLEQLPSIITTYKNWRKLQPGSSIMSTSTGYRFDYASAPYRDYHRTQEVKYHIMRSSDNLPNKEMVLGVQIGYRTKAYPFSELRKTDGDLEDTFNGTTYTVHYDDASSSAWVTDKKGEKIPGTSMYWFAWYAFHPETVVFWNDERGQ